MLSTALPVLANADAASPAAVDNVYWWRGKITPFGAKCVPQKVGRCGVQFRPGRDRQNEIGLQQKQKQKYEEIKKINRKCENNKFFLALISLQSI